MDFFAYSLTAKRPLFDLRLFLERNFTLGTSIHCIFGMLFVTPLVLIPTMVQQLSDVPSFTIGFLIGSRFVATAIAMLAMMLAVGIQEFCFYLALAFTHTQA